jgi:O-antigen ligase
MRGVSSPFDPSQPLRPRRPPGRPEVALAIGLVWAVVFSLLGWLATISVLAYQGLPTALALAAFVVGPAVGLWWVTRAGARGGVFLLVMVVAVILLSDLSLRGRSERLDAQSAVKFALWLSGLLLLPWRVEVLARVRQHLPTLALGLFGLWALASTVYSITLVYTLAAALAFLGLWTTAVVLATAVEEGRAMRWVTATLGAMAAASLLLYAAAPDIAMVVYENSTVLRLGGIFGNANALGGVSALALLLIALAWFGVRYRGLAWMTLLVVPVCGACLVLTQSRTAMLGLVAAVLVVGVRRLPFLLLPLLALGASAVVVIVAYPGALDVLIALVARSGRVEQVTTFTGRTEIWQFVMAAIAEAPVLGYGFASTRELIPAGYAGPYGWTTTSAHNLWLQTWVSTGLIGLALVLMAQLASLRALFATPRPLRDGMLVYVLFAGLFEPGPLGPSVNLLTFMWIWATASALPPRGARA